MFSIIEPFGEKQFEIYYQIRYEALRKPWGKPKGSEKDDLEHESLHFMALENEIPLGVCRLQYNSDSEAQIRFMAVNEIARGKGIGKLMIEFAEHRALKDGRNFMILQARDYAVPFYEKSGYKLKEKTFLLWNLIQHYLMEKSLD
jgi:GNAT superfamily N-acetyltransferase